MSDFITSFKHLQKQIKNEIADLNPVSDKTDKLRLHWLHELKEHLNEWANEAYMMELWDDTPVTDDDIESAWRRMDRADDNSDNRFGTEGWDD